MSPPGKKARMFKLTAEEKRIVKMQIKNGKRMIHNVNQTPFNSTRKFNSYEMDDFIFDEEVEEEQIYV